jgi:hypothetical protein
MDKDEQVPPPVPTICFLSRDPQLKPKKPWKPGVLDCAAGATPILFYPNGEVAGVRVEGKHKMFYFEFSLQDIVSIEARRELVRRILAWFDAK